jgi:hypothetical protein
MSNVTGYKKGHESDEPTYTFHVDFQRATVDRQNQKNKNPFIGSFCQGFFSEMTFDIFRFLGGINMEPDGIRLFRH